MSYRNAVSDIIQAVQVEYKLTDTELAERIACSKGTVANARNKVTNLDGVTLANIEYEFGPSALDPFLKLGGSRAIPIEVGDASANATLELSEALHLLIKTQDPASPGGTATTAEEVKPIVNELRDARTALDALISMAEARPLRVVGPASL